MGPNPVYGTLGNRPTAVAAGDRALYVVTDQANAVYQVQSGAWVQLVGSASLTTDHTWTGKQAFSGGASIRSGTSSLLTLKPLGEGSAGMFEFVHDDTAGGLTHFHSGPNSGAGTFLYAGGSDYGAADIGLWSAKNSGIGFRMISNGSHTGGALQYMLGYSATAFPLRIDSFVGSPGVAMGAYSGQGAGDGVVTAADPNKVSSTVLAFTGADVGATLSQTTTRPGDPFLPAGTTITSVSGGVATLSAAFQNVPGGGATGLNLLVSGRAIGAAQKILAFYQDATRIGGFYASTFQWTYQAELIGGTGANPNQLTITGGNTLKFYNFNSGTSDYVRTGIETSQFGMSLVSYTHNAKGSESGRVAFMQTNQSPTGLVPQLGFFGATPVAKPAITGSRGGNAGLASALTALAALGLITDSTTA